MMKDDISKQKGLPYSTSRSQELANKKNTKKARRQAGKKIAMDFFPDPYHDADAYLRD